jgi:hypothetical protein
LFKRPADQLATHYWLCSAISPLVDIAAVAKMIEPGQLDWDVVMAQAHRGMVLPLLYRSLVQKQLLDCVPKEVGQALEGFFDLNVLLNSRLRAQVKAVTVCLNQHDIEHVWLKGATHLLRADWQQSPRTMLDLDVWIPHQSQHDAAFKQLAAMGYKSVAEEGGQFLGSGHHYPSLFKNGESARLEFHASLVRRQYSPLLPDGPALNNAQWHEWEGEKVGVLNPVDQAMHAYIQCVHMSGNQFLTGQVTLMKTHDFVERLTLAGPNTFKSESFQCLHEKPWYDLANMFFTYLGRSFGVASDFNTNTLYEDRLRYPRLARLSNFYQRTLNCICEGQVGPWHDLPARLWRNIREIFSAKVA